MGQHAGIVGQHHKNLHYYEQHDHIATSNWYRERITDPYKLIKEIFSFADVYYFRTTIENVLLHASTSKICRKDDPARLILEFRMLEAAIDVAYILNKKEKHNEVEVDDYNLLDKKLFCGTHKGTNEWHFFPRTLSLKEYKYPTFAFTNFFRYQKLLRWKQHLEKALHYALSSNVEDLDIDPPSMFLSLTRLIEAAHLLNIRTARP